MIIGAGISFFTDQAGAVRCDPLRCRVRSEGGRVFLGIGVMRFGVVLTRWRRLRTLLLGRGRVRPSAIVGCLIRRLGISPVSIRLSAADRLG